MLVLRERQCAGTGRCSVSSTFCRCATRSQTTAYRTTLPLNATYVALRLFRPIPCYHATCCNPRVVRCDPYPPGYALDLAMRRVFLHSLLMAAGGARVGARGHGHVSRRGAGAQRAKQG